MCRLGRAWRDQDEERGEKGWRGEENGMKRGSGMKGRVERSRGMEILNAEAIFKIKLTDSLRRANAHTQTHSLVLELFCGRSRRWHCLQEAQSCRCNTACYCAHRQVER
jgi:hypothetical protein